MTDHTLSHDVESERHRAECAECRELWTELEAIAAEAKQLPLLTPSRDLWSGIEARITAPTSLASRRPAFYRTQTFRLAMAASLLVAVTSAVTWRLATRPAATVDIASAPSDTAMDATNDDATTRPAADLPPAGEAQAYLAAFSESVSQMDREIAALQGIVTERRDDLDPRTVEVLEKNLQVIDAAIAEARAALSADPASQFLAQQFTRAYTSKLTLLRGAAQLPAGI